MKLEKIEQTLFPNTSLWTCFSEQGNIVGADKKERERKVIRLMLCEILSTDSFELVHDPKGKPFLIPNLGNISIAHSDGYFAIAYSSSDIVGVDIQTHHSRLDKAKDYYMNDQEQAALHSCPKPVLFQIWSAKEAIYKLFGGKISNLRDEVTVRVTSKQFPEAEFNDETLKLFCDQNDERTLMLCADGPFITH